MESSRGPLFPEQALGAFQQPEKYGGSHLRELAAAAFYPDEDPAFSALAAVRRFFDIQAGSAWRDLSGVLPSLQADAFWMSAAARNHSDRWWPGGDLHGHRYRCRQSAFRV